MKKLQALLASGIWALTIGCGSAEVTVEPTPQPPPPPPPAMIAAPAPAPLQVAEDAVLEGDRIRIAKAIHYDVDKDAIQPESFPVLNAVVNIIKTHPEIIALTVEGHTDNQGTLEHNHKLSERRANAVVRYLFAQGVTIPMQAPGYGISAPLCAELTDECRARNRRVEFRVKRR